MTSTADGTALRMMLRTCRSTTWTFFGCAAMYSSTDLKSVAAIVDGAYDYRCPSRKVARRLGLFGGGWTVARSLRLQTGREAAHLAERQASSSDHAGEYETWPSIDQCGHNTLSVHLGHELELAITCLRGDLPAAWRRKEQSDDLIPISVTTRYLCLNWRCVAVETTAADDELGALRTYPVGLLSLHHRTTGEERSTRRPARVRDGPCPKCAVSVEIPVRWANSVCVWVRGRYISHHRRDSTGLAWPRLRDEAVRCDHDE
jgi:hypothetical protein